MVSEWLRRMVVPWLAATVPGNDESDPTLIVPVLGSLEADSSRNLTRTRNPRAPEIYA